jgi:hypothetical protein
VTLSVDIREPDWIKALNRAGYDRARGTVWILEGFLRFFSNAQVRVLLDFGMHHVRRLLCALLLWAHLVSHVSLSSTVLVVTGARVHPYEQDCLTDLNRSG